MPSRTTRRPPPKHRAPRHRRDPRRAWVLAAATASLAVAATATATVSLPPRGGGGTSSTGVTAAGTSPALAAALGRAATDREPAPDRPAPGAAAYSGAEERTVLERSARSRPVSRDAHRRPAGRAEAAAADRRDRAGPDRREERATTSDAEQHGSGRRAPTAPAWALPLAAAYRLTAGFGECSGLWGRCHTGLDFAAPSGTPVLAVAAGTITEVGWAGAYGNRAVLTLEDGTEVWYCHLDAVTVGLRAEVAAGQGVGTVGTTGNTTGPHLHLEVRPGAGDPVDPAAALAAHGLTP